ncbi:uncharacterized protein LOC127535005 [Acanthochromis polyacanthus]|uniref:uncharacterized protein LOC127535005 n=1 Tax=Acanthochromis polyacanthus TaxID=80966 RepID=UPI0022348FF7|nr:uncharacterized protein LOC127535005 [Acanthochromis polyacanthus]
MGHPLTVLTTHSVVAFVNSAAFTMTSLRQTRMEKILSAPNITYTHEGINMAEQMGEGEPHECELKVKTTEKIRIDLSAVPLEGEQEVLFTDGCCYRHPAEGLKAGYAVMRQVGERIEEVETGTLTHKQSAQLAELTAVIKALKQSKDKRVNTDSAYVVSEVHIELPQWKRVGFITAAKKTIKHGEEMRELAEALLLPREVAVVKCRGHDKAGTAIAQGNEAADEAAKRVSGCTPNLVMIQTEKQVTEILPEITTQTLKEAQNRASPEEKTMWREEGAKVDEDGVWKGEAGTPVLPTPWQKVLLQQVHGLAHVNSVQMRKNLQYWWHPYMTEMTNQYMKDCRICTEHNPKPTVKPEAGRFPAVNRPGQEIVIDNTDMVTRVRGYTYLLVAVDSYTGWPEAWPTTKEDSKAVIKCLINHYIPTHGFPRRIRSDNGAHFKNKDLRAVEQMLGLQHAFGTVYHPQSQGKVERMNQNLKGKLAKTCAHTGMTWLDALPVALMSVRSTINRSTGFTPFELSTGRQFPGPREPLEISAGEKQIGYKPYFDQLTALVTAFSTQVTDKREEVKENQEPNSAEWVLLKVFKRKWSEPLWSGPFQVTERTSHAVRLRGRGDTWYHWSMCVPAQEPQRSREGTRKDLSA